jgi:hypothetical protein
MRIMISADGDHEPKGLLYMVVDGNGFLIDLSGVQGTLVDPTIKRVEWGPTVINNEGRDAGTIVRQDDTQQTFFDFDLIRPYVDAFNVRRAALMSNVP